MSGVKNVLKYSTVITHKAVIPIHLSNKFLSFEIHSLINQTVCSNKLNKARYLYTPSDL
jgi:hypothetical protein